MNDKWAVDCVNHDKLQKCRRERRADNEKRLAIGVARSVASVECVLIRVHDVGI